jgi:hypothetical protein
MFRQRETRHLEVFASNPLHDRINGLWLHMLAATLDSMRPNWPFCSNHALVRADRAKRIATSSATSNDLYETWGGPGNSRTE